MAWHDCDIVDCAARPEIKQIILTQFIWLYLIRPFITTDDMMCMWQKKAWIHNIHVYPLIQSHLQSLLIFFALFDTYMWSILAVLPCEALINTVTYWTISLLLWLKCGHFLWITSWTVAELGNGKKKYLFPISWQNLYGAVGWELFWFYQIFFNYLWRRENNGTSK